jgi:mRNA interferase MazF
LKRGEFYLVYRGDKQDPKNQRVFVIVSRQSLIGTAFSSVVCAPVYTNFEGSLTQLAVGIDEGLKHESAVICDALVSIPKTLLTNYVGKLSTQKLRSLNRCLIAALELEEII